MKTIFIVAILAMIIGGSIVFGLTFQLTNDKTSFEFAHNALVPMVYMVPF